MKNYDKYNLEDFVQDPYFRQWALGTLEPKDNFWEIWCNANPEKEALIQEACSVVVGLACEREEVEASEVAEAIAKIRTKLHNPPFFRRSWFSYAAAVLLPAATLWALWLYTDNSASAGRKNSDNAHPSGMQWNVNEGTGASVVTLADGSTVRLSPSSKIGTAAGFGRVNRSVWLEGEAVFDVVRNPDLPFTVQSHNVVTKVLGTVFQVRAYDQEADVSVSVRSGKVTVQKKTAESPESENTAEMILTPNQQAVISKTNDKILKTLVARPGIIREPEQHRHFQFNDTPISEVFSALEQAYGIPIAYDAEKMANCNLTAKLIGEDLFNRMDLICETIHASYRVTDGQILVTGNGCD